MPHCVRMRPEIRVLASSVSALTEQLFRVVPGEALRNRRPGPAHVVDAWSECDRALTGLYWIWSEESVLLHTFSRRGEGRIRDISETTSCSIGLWKMSRFETRALVDR